jgi:stage II sporulation protein AA (anti-sigma F factor antagonist)
MPAAQSPRLQIDTADRDGALVVALSGELDAGTTGELERSLSAVLDPRPLVVLDLHELSFVDSIGVNMLFRMREWAEVRGVTLRVVRAPVHVQRLLALAALDGSMGPFYVDVAAALRA